jgi:N-acetyl-gamma-glutamyl-phosphate reductase
MTSPETRRAAILGAAGFTGKELLRILAAHPIFSPGHVTSDRHAGKTLLESFPDLPAPRENLTFKTHADSIPAGMPVLLATPNEVSLSRVPELLAAGHRVVDLSGAFRLHNADEFRDYYKLEHTNMDLARKAVYGLPELFREQIQKADLVANPGCFPTGSILPLHLLEPFADRIVGISIDAKSGVSGAGGRTEDGGFSYTSVYENFRAYKILGHQHWPEIVQYAAGGSLKSKTVFTPHLLPLFRGILSTITVFFDGAAPDVQSILKENCASMRFVRILPAPEDVQLSAVQRTNYLDMSARIKGSQAVIVTAIDNLVKGAAGQAVQNLNLMFGLPEEMGLA